MCASTALGTNGMAALGLLIPPLKACFVTQLSSLTIISSKVAGILMPELEGKYDQIIAQVTKDWKASMPKLQVINRIYKYINDNVNRTYVNDICLKIYKTMKPGQFQCLLDKGNKIFDLRTYPCITGPKANLMSGK